MLGQRNGLHCVDGSYGVWLVKNLHAKESVVFLGGLFVLYIEREG